MQLVLYRDVLRHCVPLVLVEAKPQPVLCHVPWFCLVLFISFPRVYLTWQERRNLVRIKSLLRILLPRVAHVHPMYLETTTLFQTHFCARPGHFGWREHEYKKLPEWFWSECKMCVALVVAKFSAEATKCEPGLRSQIWSHLVLCRVGFLTKKNQIDWSFESFPSLINILAWTKPLCCEVKFIFHSTLNQLNDLGFRIFVIVQLQNAISRKSRDIGISKSQGLEMDFLTLEGLW